MAHLTRQRVHIFLQGKSAYTIDTQGHQEQQCHARYLMPHNLFAHVLIGLPTLVTLMGHCLLDHIRSQVMHDWRNEQQPIDYAWAAEVSEVHWCARQNSSVP